MSKIKKKRIDDILLKKGLADSKKKAHALIMSGIVLADEKRVEKPSEAFSNEIKIRIKGETSKIKYVGRGGLKLEKALKDFQICSNEYICLDVGSSTGGFTDCLLQNGAKKVFAIDSGTNQLDWKLRNDNRVEVQENTNARYLKKTDFNEQFDLITIDVSFISVTKIFPALIPLLKNKGNIIVLIKPQFELKKEEIEKGGIVTNTEKHRKVIFKINEFAKTVGFKKIKIIESPILGAKGNREFLALYEKF